MGIIIEACKLVVASIAVGLSASIIVAFALSIRNVWRGKDK